MSSLSHPPESREGGSDTAPEAIVIGGGAAGLATAAELGRRGITAVVLERADEIGNSWHRRYEGLRLNTARRFSAPRHSRIPRSAGRWPTREAFAAHLRGYAVREGIAIERGIEALRIERGDDGYTVETSHGPRSAHLVVVATGYDHTPILPAWHGREDFAGDLIHAADYCSASDFRNKDVLVVGAGNTGTEIAVQLHRAGAARVRIAVRTPPNIMPLELFGIPITLFALLGEGQSAGADLFGRIVQRLVWGDLSEHGLLPSPYGIGTELRLKGLGPVVDRGFVGTLKAGQVEIVPAVQGFDGADVCLASGGRIQPQAVIAATGYRMGLEPLVGHLGLLTPAGRPTCVRGEENPAAPGLYFNGFWLPASGQLPAMRRTTKRIGQEIARQGRKDRT
ncbi:MAG TPA: NAD(P)/FAD-dependent oxidoreductase [Solirubrobacterales bacterium]